MTERKIRFKYALLCDDIRQETSGKFIFIGVYGGDSIQFPVFPAQVALYLALFLESAGPCQAEIKMEARLNGERMMGMAGEIGSNQEGEAFIPLQFPPLTFKEAGELEIRLRLSQGRWQKAISLDVTPQKHES